MDGAGSREPPRDDFGIRAVNRRFGADSRGFRIFCLAVMALIVVAWLVMQAFD